MLLPASFGRDGKFAAGIGVKQDAVHEHRIHGNANLFDRGQKPLCLAIRARAPAA